MSMRSSRRVRAAAGVGALALILAACGGGADDPSEGAADEEATGDEEFAEAETVTIGVLAPMEGDFGEIGENIAAGAELAVQHAEEDGRPLNGQITIELDVRDSQANPDAATQATRDLLADDVNLFTGLLTTSACLAVAPTIEQTDAVLVTSVCAGNDVSGAFTGEAPYERTFAMAPRDYQVSVALADVIAEKHSDITDYNVFGYDYSWGRDTWESFQNQVIDRGVDLTLNQEHWVPLGESNFRSQVSAMSRGLGDRDTSALFLSTFGAGTAGFLQQADAFDLTDEVALVATAGGYYPVARTLDGAAPEVWNAYDYSYAAYDNEMNDRFVADFLDKTGELPVSWSYQGYVSTLALIAAIDEAGSGDSNAVRDALEGIEFEAPNGMLSIDPDTHQATAPVVVTHTRGDPDAEEGVEIIDSFVVEPVQEMG